MSEIRLFFTTDIHGSEKCFLKFLEAGRFYKADILILGGDITGKMVVPIVKDREGIYHAEYLSRQWNVRNRSELEQLEKSIRFTGSYPYLTDSDEMEELRADQSKVDKLFTSLMMESVKRWVEIAEAKLSKSGIRCFVTPGNDDRFDIDQILRDSKCIVNPEGIVIDLPLRRQMISMGYSNITPWNAPRECDEDQLAEKINSMVKNVEDPRNCIFNFHCPPYDTPLDFAPKLDSNLRPVLSAGGEPIMVSVGSISVRKAIEEYQPLLGLHGHIHESRGTISIGRTLCLNPGSEYGEGVLRGAIINLDATTIKSHQFTAG